MNPNKLGLKDYLAVLIAIAALVALGWMFNAETAVEGSVALNPGVLTGLKDYAWAMGLILLAAGVAYILLGRDEDIITGVERPDGKK